MFKIIPKLEWAYSDNPELMVDKHRGQFMDFAKAMIRYNEDYHTKILHSILDGESMPEADITFMLISSKPKYATFYLDYNDYFTNVTEESKVRSD